jgi:putative transposase
MGAYLLRVLENSRKLFPEVEILTKETDIDHVHLLVSIPPKYSVAEVVGYMKGKSAHAMRRRFPHLQRVFYGSDGLWSDGYFVSTVGVDEETIRRYIEHQGKEDAGQATLEL